MKQVTKNDLNKIKKLNQIAVALKQGEDFNITRLTTIKSLCKDPEIAAHFCFHLAQLTYNKAMKKHGSSKKGDWKVHLQLMEKAIEGFDSYLRHSTKSQQERVWQLFRELEAVNNEYQYAEWGPIRIIRNSEVLLIEYALQSVLRSSDADFWAYQTARHYAERYDSGYGTGLIPASAPLVRDIVDFWCNFYSIEL